MGVLNKLPHTGKNHCAAFCVVDGEKNGGRVCLPRGPRVSVIHFFFADPGVLPLGVSEPFAAVLMLCARMSLAARQSCDRVSISSSQRHKQRIVNQRTAPSPIECDFFISAASFRVVVESVAALSGATAAPNRTAYERDVRPGRVTGWCGW